MDRQQEIARRIQFLRAELESLAQLIALGGGDEASLEAVADAAEEKKSKKDKPKKERWSYRPGTWYRIVGANPFRAGNNLEFFEYVKELFGEAPFSREQLAEAYEAMRKEGHIDTRQSEESYNLVFLRTAGQAREAIEMVARPGDDLPPEAA